MSIDEFQKKYRSKAKREEQLKSMSDKEIQEIIDSCSSVYGKIYYSGFLKNKKR